MADQAINALSTKTAPETSDQLLLVGAGEPQLIDYDKLADAILNKITSKNYALDAGQMTLLAALNKLNSESQTLDFIECRVKTVLGTAPITKETIINGNVPSLSSYIPVVIGHNHSNDVVENVFYDSIWYIASNVEQETIIRFYKTIVLSKAPIENKE